MAGTTTRAASDSGKRPLLAVAALAVLLEGLFVRQVLVWGDAFCLIGYAPWVAALLVVGRRRRPGAPIAEEWLLLASGHLMVLWSVDSVDGYPDKLVYNGLADVAWLALNLVLLAALVLRRRWAPALLAIALLDVPIVSAPVFLARQVAGAARVGSAACAAPDLLYYSKIKGSLTYAVAEDGAGYSALVFETGAGGSRRVAEIPFTDGQGSMDRQSPAVHPVLLWAARRWGPPRSCR